MEKQYEIQVSVKRIQGEKNGKEYNFLAYEGYTKNGDKCRFKFTNECNNVPQETGNFILTVDKKDINRDKGNRYNVFWIKNVIKCEKFDNVYDNDEDLPF